MLWLSARRLCLERRARGEIATRGDAELAVDVACVGANGLDADM
jgi:hypothetical protein